MNSYPNNANNSYQSNRTVERAATNNCDLNNMTLLRKDLMGELEAINQYEAHIAQLTSDVAKTVLSGIRDEEIIHTGELLALLDYLCPTEATLRAQGKQEVMNMLGQNGKNQ